MLKEIDSAIHFLCGLLRARSLSLELLDSFRTILFDVMHGRYQDHWFPDKPFKGSAYRCMRINDRCIDPLIERAGAEAGLSQSQLLQLLPNQLTIWVDPHEVSYRIGEDGSIGTLYEAKRCPTESSLGTSSGDTSTAGTLEEEGLKSSSSAVRVSSKSNSELVLSVGGAKATFSISCRQEMINEQKFDATKGSPSHQHSSTQSSPTNSSSSTHSSSSSNGSSELYLNNSSRVLVVSS